MEKIGPYEAKTHLPQLLKRVAKGEAIIITKHGIPVATMQAPETGTGCSVQKERSSPTCGNSGALTAWTASRSGK